MTLHSTTVGSGPAQVVLLHGFLGQGKNWTTIAQGIADVATCHLVDLPNHGRSPWTDEFSLDSQAGLVAAWLREGVRRPVVLVGHSLGGKVAMRLALTHPDLVERLMVVDIAPAEADARAGFAHLIAALQALDITRLSSRTEADRLLSDAITDPQVRGFLLQNLRRESGAWRWAANLDLLARSLPEVGSWSSDGAPYPGPVWWVAGGRSDYIQPHHLPVMRALFPRVVTMTLKRAGHWVHADDPAAFTATLRAFLAAR